MRPLEREFGEQLRRLMPRARALTHDRSLAQDLVQEALARGWTFRDRWQAGTDLGAWLYTIMRREFINRMRSAKRPTVPINEAACGKCAATQHWQLAIRDLDRALDTLPPDQRIVVLLASIEEMPYDDIASLLEIPVGTVKSRIARARARLRELTNGTLGSRMLRRAGKTTRRSSCD